MMLVRCHLAPSPIHGLGVFLSEPVKCNAPVWSFSWPTDIVLPPTDPSWWPASAREFVARYSYTRGDKRRVLCGDFGKFMNHSETPSLVGEGTDYAVRDLAVGEELTCDYRTFDRDWYRKLEGR